MNNKEKLLAALGRAMYENSLTFQRGQKPWELLMEYEQYSWIDGAEDGLRRFIKDLNDGNNFIQS